MWQLFKLQGVLRKQIIGVTDTCRNSMKNILIFRITINKEKKNEHFGLFPKNNFDLEDPLDIFFSDFASLLRCLHAKITKGKWLFKNDLSKKKKDKLFLSFEIVANR